MKDSRARCTLIIEFATLSLATAVVSFKGRRICHVETAANLVHFAVKQIGFHISNYRNRMGRERKREQQRERDGGVDREKEKEREMLCSASLHWLVCVANSADLLHADHAL